MLRPSDDPMPTALTLWATLHGLLALHSQGRFGGDDALLRSVVADSLEHLMAGVAP